MKHFSLAGPVTWFEDYGLTFDLYGKVTVEDVPCLFTVEVERYSAEGGGWTHEATATLVGGTLGNLFLNRQQMFLMFGVDYLKFIEHCASTRYVEEHFQ